MCRLDLGTADPVWKSYAPGYGLSAKSAWKRNRGNQEGDEDMKEVDWSSFFQRLDTLPRGERASLKREAGTMLSQADGQAMRVFFQCLPFSIPQWQEERAFAAA